MKYLTVFTTCLLSAFWSGCASQWKIHGGPKECVEICGNWDMELVGMVAVGNQDETGPGATACVCELPGKSAGAREGASGTAANTAAVVVAIEEAERQQQQQAAAAPPAVQLK